MRLICILTFLIILTSCEKQITFDSKKWKVYKDLEVYPHRELMLRDIIDNKRLIGLSYQSVIDSLGQPENYTDKKENQLWYPVIVDYGSDIDPVYLKRLMLTMNNDSTVEKVEIIEWKTGD